MAYGFAARALGCVAATALATTLAARPQETPGWIETHAAERARYLADAVIWRDPGELAPQMIKQGPPAPLPSAIPRPSFAESIDCRFEEPGESMGGHTPKFACRTGDGRLLRIKYYDATEHGNREVFAEIAATRLLWALGFDADAMFSVAITCRECPANPMTGSGPRATRQYIAAYEPHYEGALITSSPDQDQGWTFGELETAIDTLTTGAVHARQRMHFDALSLLAVFMQHGDRKRSQQRLVCRSGVDDSQGDLGSTPAAAGPPIPVLLERSGARACSGETVVTLQDVGATFGGAGKLSSNKTAKMNLKSWAAELVFEKVSRAEPVECRGNITVSGAAGNDSRAHPRIGEAGRQFLATQLERLSPDHIRAIFDASRVDQMEGAPQWRDPTSGRTYSGIDAWVAVFQDKVRQVREQRCSNP